MRQFKVESSLGTQKEGKAQQRRCLSKVGNGEKTKQNQNKPAVLCGNW